MPKIYEQTSTLLQLDIKNIFSWIHKDKEVTFMRNEKFCHKQIFFLSGLWSPSSIEVSTQK